MLGADVFLFCKNEDRRLSDRRSFSYLKVGIGRAVTRRKGRLNRYGLTACPAAACRECATSGRQALLWVLMGHSNTFCPVYGTFLKENGRVETVPVRYFLCRG